MSYDLAVFDPSVAPRDREGFLRWFEEWTEREDEQELAGPETGSQRLQSWYENMHARWPDMNGTDLSDDDADSPYITGYSFTPYLIYVDFRWSVAEEAYAATREAAVLAGVGFYDVSGDEGDGEIYFPGDELRAETDGAWRQISADFRTGDLNRYTSQEEPQKRSWLDFFRRTK